MFLLSEVRVYETYLRIFKSKSLIIPIFNISQVTGLVADFIIENLKLQPVAYINVKEVQPLMYVYSGMMTHPYTIYFNPKYPVMVLKIPFILSMERANQIFPKITDALMDWAERNEVKRAIAIDCTVPLGEEAKEVYFVTEEHLVAEMAKLGFKPFSGILKSSGAYLLDECMRRNIDGILLVAESDFLKLFVEIYEAIAIRKIDERTLAEMAKKVDIDAPAAIRLLEAISKITGVKFNVNALMQRKEMFRSVVREIMDRLSRRERIELIYR